MSPEQLKNELAQKFDIVGMVDLAALSENQTNAYKFFKSVYQSAYNHNQRIVVYTNQTVSDSLVMHLYKTVNFLDITNCFVLMCGPQNLATQLKSCAEKTQQHSMPFETFAVELDGCRPLSNNFDLPDTICAVPWMNVEIRTTGEITPCCLYTDSIGHIQKDQLLDVFHGTQMQRLRQDLVNGIKHPGCNRCWNRESQGLTSMRQHNAKRLRDDFMTRYFDEPQMTMLDIKFQNTCNFKCRICNAEHSSMHAQEQQKTSGIPMLPQNNWSESEKFIDQIQKQLPNISNIDMYGGEPFLIKNFSKVLKSAVDTNLAKNIRLHYNTNGSVWPGEIVDYWPHFKEVDIHFSIDAVGEQFELQRGGSWKDVEANILKLKNLNLPNMTCSVMPSVSIMNVLYIDQVLDWAHMHGFQIFVNYVIVPSEFALSNLTNQAKQLILSKHQHNTWPEMKNILSLVESSSGTDGRSFCEKTQWYDRVRKENFAKHHNEIAQAMGYVYNKDL